MLQLAELPLGVLPILALLKGAALLELPIENIATYTWIHKDKGKDKDTQRLLLELLIENIATRCSLHRQCWIELEFLIDIKCMINVYLYFTRQMNSILLTFSPCLDGCAMLCTILAIAGHLIVSHNLAVFVIFIPS